MFLANIQMEFGAEFLDGEVQTTADFFDRWWTANLSDGIQAEDLDNCDVELASDLLDRLDRPEREHIFSMQSDTVRAVLRSMLEVDNRPQGPQAGGLLYEETDYFKPFPDPADVFADDVETHLKYLLPLATVSLKQINPTWDGSIHFVQPIEPYDGVVGELTSKHHSPLCGENWIGYRIDDHGRYTFAADWEYFLLKNLESGHGSRFGIGGSELKEHYEKARRSYAAHRSHFRKYGAIHLPYALEEYGAYRDRDRLELVNQLGGKPGWGNWATMENWPLSEHACDEADEVPDETYPLPQSNDGTDFSYVGWLHSFTYLQPCGCNLELFYHPELRLALTTFDWS